MKAVLWNKEAEARKVSRWRVLNHQSFYSVLNIDEFPRGWFPCSPSHLSLIFLSLPPLLQPQPNAQTLSSIQGHEDTPRRLSSRLRAFASFVFSPAFKVQMCVQNFGNPKSLFEALTMWRNIFRPEKKRVSSCVLCTSHCCPTPELSNIL